jgi:isopenicillin N synthase-like dioxygenase
MQGIPSLNLQQFNQNNESETRKFVQELGAGFENIGFVTVYNHGIPETLLLSFYNQIQQFFHLPEDIKLKYVDHAGGQRGYTPFGVEHAKGNPLKDLKEFWHFGRDISDPFDPLHSVYPKNKWVEELPDFNTIGQKVFMEMERVGAIILKAIAIYLKLEPEYFTSKIFNGNAILRAIHYPPINQNDEPSIRAGAHEDINLITLLTGASASGLQVLDKSGQWLDVNHVNEHLVINVGDMLQRLTNNTLVSTTHRVINPVLETDTRKSRFSIPFFLHPRPETDLTCLPQCVGNGQVPLYEPITAGDFLQQRLKEIGLL